MADIAGKKPALSGDEQKQAKKALEVLFASEYVNKRALYKENFIRGLMFGSGTIIGTAIILTAILWILSLLGHIPFIEPIVNNVEQTLQSAK